MEANLFQLMLSVNLQYRFPIPTTCKLSPIIIQFPQRQGDRYTSSETCDTDRFHFFPSTAATTQHNTLKGNHLYIHELTDTFNWCTVIDVVETVNLASLRRCASFAPSASGCRLSVARGFAQFFCWANQKPEKYVPSSKARNKITNHLSLHIFVFLSLIYIISQKKSKTILKELKKKKNQSDFCTAIEAWNQYPWPAGGLSQWELHYRLSQVRCPILTSDPYWQSQNKLELKGARARIAMVGGKERPKGEHYSCISGYAFLPLRYLHMRPVRLKPRCKLLVIKSWFSKS